MKKLFVRLLGVIVIVLICDVVVGFCGRAYINNLSEYSFALAQKCNVMLNKEADILIIGASKANHNYITDRFSQNGLTVFNAGIDGTDCYVALMALKSCSARKVPQLVIFDISGNQVNVSPGSLVDKYAFLYNQNPVVDILLDKELSQLEKLKLKSNLYRYNKMPETIVSLFVKKNKTAGGYVPLFGDFSNGDFKEAESFSPNDNEVSYLSELVDYCKRRDICLVLSVSPSCVNNKDFDLWLENYCHDNQVYLVNSNKLFWGHLELFVDYDHLNEEGSKLFTNYFLEQLDSLLTDSSVIHD